MFILLTEKEAQEAIEAIRNGIRQGDGLVRVVLPLGGLQHETPHGSRKTVRFDLSFSVDSRTVRYGKREIRLSHTQFSLLHYVHQHGRASVEELQDEVWEQDTSDNAIRQACHKTSDRLLKKEVPYTLVIRRGFVSLESVTYG